MCVDTAGTKTYGATACEAVIAAYKTDAGVPNALLTLDETTVEANITCFEGNLATNPAITGVINCSLMPMANGLYQYRDKSSITCVNPVTSQ